MLMFIGACAGSTAGGMKICLMQISRFTASKPSKFAFASDEKSIRQQTTSFVRCYLKFFLLIPFCPSHAVSYLSVSYTHLDVYKRQERLREMLGDQQREIRVVRLLCGILVAVTVHSYNPIRVFVDNNAPRCV